MALLAGASREGGLRGGGNYVAVLTSDDADIAGVDPALVLVHV